MASLSDVATASGVSVSVASRVINEVPGLRIRPETRARVLAAAKRLQYVPNQTARGLRLGVTGTLGLVLPAVTRAFSELVDGVEDAAAEHGQTLLLARTERVAGGGDALRRLVREGRVDGLIFQQPDDPMPDAVLQDLVQNIPVVLINDRRPRIGSVTLDDVRGIEVTTEHLIDLGHREIGYIGGLPETYTAEPRAQGFRSALRDAGLRRRAAWCTALGYTVQDGRAAVEAIWSRSGPTPTALVVANPNAACGVLAELRHRGLRVPDDVSVAALNETWVVDLVTPTLTTVRMPLHALGVAATEMLLERLKGQRPEARVVGETAPVVHHRESTAPPPP